MKIPNITNINTIIINSKIRDIYKNNAVFFTFSSEKSLKTLSKHNGAAFGSSTF